jgi:hypothetical protein
MHSASAQVHSPVASPAPIGHSTGLHRSERPGETRARPFCVAGLAEQGRQIP